MHFTSTDSQAILPRDSMLTNGTGSFSATLNTTGSQTITATDTVTASITGSSKSIEVARFIPTGSMTTARELHTATLLGDGKVLIAGGSDGVDYLKTAELFDPSTGTFTATASMNAARIFHTATLLGDGKVLIAGGYDGKATLATAELFDPLTGTFTAAGSMTTARDGHTATLLSNGTLPNNGKVLIAGGVGGLGILATAELFDPSTGIFTSTGSLPGRRGNHTATLLKDGMVLVTGGQGLAPFSIFCHVLVPVTLPFAELYDPTSGTFTSTINMTTPREEHTATLLTNGVVLVTGGFQWTVGTGCPPILTRVDTASAELFEQ